MEREIYRTPEQKSNGWHDRAGQCVPIDHIGETGVTTSDATRDLENRQAMAAMCLHCSASPKVRVNSASRSRWWSMVEVMMS